MTEQEQVVVERVGNYDKEQIENWGIYRCLDCNRHIESPTFLHEDEDRTSYCTNCEMLVKWERTNK